MSDPSKARPHGHVLRIVVAVTATLALFVSVGAGFSAVRWVQLRHVGTVPLSDFGRTGPEASGGPGVSATPSAQALPTSDCARHPCNYLLLGSDSRAGLSAQQQQEFGTNQQIGGSNRADTIMLVHTDPALQKAIVLSFPRDLWVHIPGVGYDKINAAFAGGVDGGGPKLMAQTVADLTGLTIDHFMYVDLAGFQKIVDTLGGVQMCIPAYNVNTPGYVSGPGGISTYYPEKGYIADPYTGLLIKPGCQTLNGTQALAYVRTRHLPCDLMSDFNRIQRQQQFISAVIHQMLRPAELLKAPTLVQPVLQSLRRDAGLLPGDLVYLVGQLRGLAGGSAASLVDFRVVPGTTAQVDVPGLGIQDIVRMDPSAKQIFAAIKQGKSIAGVGTTLINTPPAEPQIRVAVVDKNSNGSADKVENVLNESGFDTTPGFWDASKAPKGVSGEAAIVYRPKDYAAATVVASYFPGVKLVASNALKGVDVAIVVTGAYTYTPPSATNGGSTSSCPAPAP
jgi:LCP family protein required for cell wall assembly